MVVRCNGCLPPFSLVHWPLRHFLWHLNAKHEMQGNSPPAVCEEHSRVANDAFCFFCLPAMHDSTAAFLVQQNVWEQLFIRKEVALTLSAMLSVKDTQSWRILLKSTNNWLLIQNNLISFIFAKSSSVWTFCSFCIFVLVMSPQSCSVNKHDSCGKLCFRNT